jgi:hypothetical protein
MMKETMSFFQVGRVQITADADLGDRDGRVHTKLPLARAAGELRERRSRQA